MFDIVLVGAGIRGMIYAKQSLSDDANFRVTGVVEPSEERRKLTGDLFNIPEDRRFESVESFVKAEKCADAVFNCTMDSIHAEVAIPILKKGYDMLIEKPLAPQKKDAERIYEEATSSGRTVMVCHVLRYAPFYSEIKKTILDRKIGKIINIQMAEQVNYFHGSVSYVRGKYADPKVCGSGMLLSKSSHDLDIMAWLMAEGKPKNVFSSGSLFQFTPENSPEGAGERCVDCQYKDTCNYSAERLYIKNPQRWAERIWSDCNLVNPTEKDKYDVLQDENSPYGRCVYYSDVKIVDHQSVLVEFPSGATGTFSMTSGASAPSRTIHMVGTKGEIRGVFEEEKFVIRCICPEAKGGFTEETVDVSGQQKGDVHGGGDELLVKDFLSLLSGAAPSICCTSIEDSMAGHEIAYLAEASIKPIK